MSADARCPRCHLAVEPIELGAHDPRPAWWCPHCAHVLEDDQAVRVPLVPTRKDLDA